jgi:hypothetical protein
MNKRKEYRELYNHLRKVYFPRWDKDRKYKFRVNIKFRHKGEADIDDLFSYCRDRVKEALKTKQKAAESKVIDITVEYENEDELAVRLILLICELIYGPYHYKACQTAILKKANIAEMENRSEVAKELNTTAQLAINSTFRGKELRRLFKKMTTPH